MNKSLCIYLLSLGVLSANLYADEFYFPNKKKWGLEFSDPSHPSFRMRFGLRFQTVLTQRTRVEEQTEKKTKDQDFYLRRGRFKIEAKYKKSYRYYMDIRNDNPNRDDDGEGQFRLGEANLEVKNAFRSRHLKFKFMRAKVDVSRSATISSRNLLHLERAQVVDEASDYVNHNRFAMNLQLLGSFDYWSFQLAAGDGVHSESFRDAKGNDLANGSIEAQNLMVGGKIRVFPIKGWKDSFTETHFAKGKHFTLGLGAFNTSGIEYKNASGSQQGKISRNLIKAEFSFHYHELSIQSEYFYFDGMIEDLSAVSSNRGTGQGHYTQIEYVLPKLIYLAPFIRYEDWNKFKQVEGYGLESYLAGINWYMQANSMRIGVAYQVDKKENNLVQVDSRGRRFNEDRQIRLTSMWLF